VSFSRNEGLGAHLSAFPARFTSSVTLFFSLLKRLQVSNLGLIGRLKVSLLLSSLYGVEFVRDKKLAEELCLVFRKGLRSFLGVPPRVSNDLLSMLFPGFSFEVFILKRKLGFLRRSLRPSDTLAAVWFLEDRAVDFPSGIGFNSELRALLDSFGLPELINCEEKSTANWALQESLAKDVLLAWERMKVAKSTSFLCSVFSDAGNFYSAAFAASSISLPSLRIFLLMWSGSAYIHLLGAHCRSCLVCGAPMDSKHFFGCAFSVCDHLQLIVWARNELFGELLRFTFSAYFEFLLKIKPVVLSEEEALLLDLSSSSTVDSLESLIAAV
jgi:hypothetical protein